MIHLSEQTEAALAARAANTGRTPDEILSEALRYVAEPMPWRSAAKRPTVAISREQLIAHMEEIAARSAARPLVDPRAPDEIIGYDDFGLPR